VIAGHSPSLRLRLVAMLGALFLGGMLVLYIAASSYARVAADRSYDRLLSGSALSIAETLSGTQGSIRVDLPYSALDMLSSAPEDRVFYSVIGPDRRLVTGYADLPGSGFRNIAGIDGGDAFKFFDAPYRSEIVRFVELHREIATQGQRGWVQVRVGQTRRAREALAQELLIGALAPIALLTVLALLAVWFGVNRTLRPLARLGEELASRQPEDLHPLPLPVPTEMTPMVGAMNGFMLRLRLNIETLRTFIADAAHQLRTPLAAIHAQVQLAEEDDPTELRATLAAVRRNTTKLTRLMDQMLSDAAVSYRSDNRSFESFDLVAVTQRSVREAVPLAEDSDVRFMTFVESAPCFGDAFTISEAIKNVVQNAITHGRRGEAEVLVSLDAQADDYLLSVADRGPGIPPHERDLVFERFARGKTDAPGAGLGLAIVRQVVTSHGGSIDLADRPGGGLVVTLRLPGRVHD